MDNLHLQWQVWTKILAFVDLILSLMALVATIVIVTFASSATNEILERQRAPKKTFPYYISYTESEVAERHAETRRRLIRMWLFVAVMAIFVLVQMGAAIMLINATGLGRDLKAARKQANIFRIINVGFLVIAIVGSTSIFASHLISTIVILYRLLAIFIVWKFINEVDASIANSIPSPVTTVPL